MSAFSDQNPSRRRRRPNLEGLEARELLSTTAASSATASTVNTTTATVQTSTPPAISGQTTTFPDPAVIARSIDRLYGPDSATPGVPTATEAARDCPSPVGRTYTISAPRFSNCQHDPHHIQERRLEPVHEGQTANKSLPAGQPRRHAQSG